MGNFSDWKNCRLCLLNGKHVLCEKPFTINGKQAKELYDLAAEKGLFIIGSVLDLVFAALWKAERSFARGYDRRNPAGKV